MEIRKQLSEKQFLIEDLWRPYFDNLELPLSSISLTREAYFIDSGLAYEFNFSESVNFLVLEEKNRFFSSLISPSYEGETTNIMEEYFARRFCFVLQENGKQIGNIEKLHFIQPSSRKVMDGVKDSWCMTFAFQSNKLRVFIAASESLTAFLEKLEAALRE